MEHLRDCNFSYHSPRYGYRKIYDTLKNLCNAHWFVVFKDQGTQSTWDNNLAELMAMKF